MPDPEQTPTPIQLGSLVRRRWVWLLLIVFGYLSSILWLGIAIVAVPFVLAKAPEGLMSIFSPKLAGTQAGEAVALRIHMIFWPVYILCVALAPRLNIHILRTLFVIIALTILLTIYGCAAHTHFNPNDLH